MDPMKSRREGEHQTGEMGGSTITQDNTHYFKLSIHSLQLTNDTRAFAWPQKSGAIFPDQFSLCVKTLNTLSGSHKHWKHSHTEPWALARPVESSTDRTGTSSQLLYPYAAHLHIGGHIVGLRPSVTLIVEVVQSGLIKMSIVASWGYSGTTSQFRINKHLPAFNLALVCARITT